jgi:hypothetical protein
MRLPEPELVRTLLRWLKDGPPGAIPIDRDGRSLGALVVASWEDAGDAALPAMTRRWLRQEVLPSEDRLLFWIKSPDGQCVGHVGLQAFDFAAHTVILDHLAIAGSLEDALVAAALVTLANWAKEQLDMTVLSIPSRYREAA